MLPARRMSVPEATSPSMFLDLADIYWLPVNATIRPMNCENLC
jgi:hypothetical protein